MAHIYKFNGLVPVVPEDSFVHPQAVLIGDVVLGHGCYIGPCASLRGDFGRIEIGDGANVQDSCVIHSFPGRAAIVEQDGHIGHGAILHGCRIGRDTLVGMNAVVMDGSEIGEACIVGAQAFVKAGTIAPARSLLAGSPAKILRQVSDQELGWKQQGTAGYQALARACLDGLEAVEPLTEEEADRSRELFHELKPLVEVKND